MPCYSYSANLPILANNVESVFNATGGTTFSYDSLYYICEIPISNQIYVYTRPSVNGVETLRVENTDYTIQGTNIVFNSAPSGQVVIRRITNDQKMLTVFNDGAKLSATELNSAFHQLLFLVQEKELSGSTYNNVFTDLNSIPAWNAGSVYQIGAIVTFSGSVYRCLQLTLAGESPTTHPAKWTLVTASSFNFVSIGGPNPVIFDFENLDPNSTLSWNGTKFVASNGVSTDLTSLTDVQLNNPPSNYAILRYDTGTSRWINSQASFNIFTSPVVTPGRVFQNLTTNESYTNGGTAVNVGSNLDQFKNANDNWVLTDPPTVYAVIQSCVPAVQTNNPVITDLRQYLTSIETRFQNVANNIANPVKVKFLWNLNEDRQNILDSATGNMLDGYQSMYWNKPSELYSAADGYYVSAGTQLKFHGILTGGNTYTTSPYFTRTTIGASTTFKSKITCYGVRHFYLSVPECVTSNLSSIPVVIANAFTSTSTLPSLSPQLKVNTNPNTIDKNALVTVKHHDFYLAAIRDFAFASMNDRTTNAVSGDTPLYNLEYSTDTHPTTAGDNNAIVKERFVRRRKSSFIGAEYNSFTDVNFKRLEGNETAVPVLWKIPKQIIYYNRQALALSASGTQPVLSADGRGIVNSIQAGTEAYDEFEQNFTSLKKELRWEGWSKPTQLTYAQSTTTELNDGTVFKADGVWSAWNYQWSSQYYLLGGINPEVFGLADIDWMCSEVGGVTATDTMKFLSLGKPEYAPPIVRSGLGAAGNPLLGSAIATNGDPLSPVGIYGGDWWPWHYRPNDIRVSSIASSWPDGLIGTHLLNIDANKLFSEASRFVPDPVDEYVFRLVCKKNLTNTFRNVGDSSNKLRTSILLEHGFASNSRFSDTSVLSSLNQVFGNNIKTATSNYLKTRVDHSKIKVYVKNEALEQIGTDTRLVITIGIIVPRVKSIGYSRIFRKLTPLGSSARIRDGITVDSEKDYGPWNWDLEVYNTDYGTTPSDYYTTGIDSFDAGAGLNSAVDWYNFDDYTNQWNSEYQGYHNGSYGSPSTTYQWTNKIATGNISTKTVFSRHNYKAVSPANKDNAWTTANNVSISGRNECAVKFVNVGIPSDLWIRLSILNTDATLNLIEGSVFANQGLDTTTISET